MRRFPITYVHASTGSPACFTLGGEAGLADFTSLFHGKGWISSSNVVTPFYQTQPADTTLLVATTFDLVGNPDGLDGRYMVYTPLSAGDTPASEFVGATKVFMVKRDIPTVAVVNSNFTSRALTVGAIIP